MEIPLFLCVCFVWLIEIGARTKKKSYCYLIIIVIIISHRIVCECRVEINTTVIRHCYYVLFSQANYE